MQFLGTNHLPRQCDELREIRTREMETLAGMLDLGFSRERGKSRLGFYLIWRLGIRGMKRGGKGG